MSTMLREKIYEILRIKTSDSSEYAIATEVLHRLNHGYRLNSVEIARKANTSKPSVTRFAQMFGFQGFRDFKIELLKQDEPYYFKIEGKEATISFDAYKSTLEQLLVSSDIYKQTIIEFSNLLMKKKRLFIFSSPENVSVAAYFSDKMRYLDIEVFSSIAGNQQFLLSKIQPDDLAIFLVTGFGFNNDSCLEIWKMINKSVITLLISTASQLKKFRNPNFEIQIEITGTPLRNIIKKNLVEYFLTQIFNIIIFAQPEVFNSLLNPKYRL